MSMYQEDPGMDNSSENFASFTFPQPNEDINQPLPIVDAALLQAPATDHRAANDFLNTATRLIDDLQKFQENVSVNSRSSERFPSPEIIKARIADLQDHLTKMTELAVSSGIAALSSDTENMNNTLWMSLDGIGHGGEDTIKVNRTFQKTEAMKKSANAVVSVLKRPNTRDVKY